jgi:hypothetical protein
MVIKTGEKLVATDITDLTFFPRGTILMFSSEAWSATSAAFKTIWKICNGQNSTPNLVNKFLRGAESSGATGGTDEVRLVKENLPQHAHTITDEGHTHRIGHFGGFGHSGNYTLQDNQLTELRTSNEKTGISINETFPNQTEYARLFSIVPAYYAVIYIMKIA